MMTFGMEVDLLLYFTVRTCHRRKSLNLTSPDVRIMRSTGGDWLVYKQCSSKVSFTSLQQRQRHGRGQTHGKTKPNPTVSTAQGPMHGEEQWYDKTSFTSLQQHRQHRKHGTVRQSQTQLRYGSYGNYCCGILCYSQFNDKRNRFFKLGHTHTHHPTPPTSTQTLLYCTWKWGNM